MADTNPERRRRLFVSLSLAALIVLLGVYLFWLDRGAGAPPPAGPDAPPVRFEDEISIRNLTREWVTYTVAPFGSLQASEVKSLKPGDMARIRESEGLVVAYWRGNEELTAVLSAGMPYCFRYNEDGALQIYPGSHMITEVEDLAPYLGTPVEVVKKMLDMAKVGPRDVVYDLGCGDGRIVIQAARRFGARGVGVDIDPSRIRDAKEAAVRAGVEARTSFRVENALKTDFGEATVLTLYLLPESNTLLRPRLELLLKPGARVVSHNYSISGWEAKLVESATVVDPSGTEHTVFLYRR